MKIKCAFFCFLVTLSLTTMNSKSYSKDAPQPFVAECPSGTYPEPYVKECKVVCHDEFIKDENFKFKNEFNNTLCNMIKNYWDASGDWKNDGMGDATTFAPALFFDLSERLSRPEFKEMAVKTVEWEVKLYENMMAQMLTGQEPQNLMETVNGIPALMTGYFYTKNKHYSDLVKVSITFAESVSVKNPDMFTYFYFDKVTVPAVISYIEFLYSRLSGDKSYGKKALKLLDVMDEKYWDVEKASYGEKDLWSTPFIVNTLIEAYLFSSEKKYIEKARLVLSHAEDNAWKKDGFYMEESSTFGLAENINFVHTYLNFYEATKEELYLDKAEKLLKYIFDGRLFDAHKGMLYHDYKNVDGRNDYFCTGCNFCTLIAILRFNDIMQSGKSKFMMQ